MITLIKVLTCGCLLGTVLGDAPSASYLPPNGGGTGSGGYGGTGHNGFGGTGAGGGGGAGHNGFGGTGPSAGGGGGGFGGTGSGGSSGYGGGGDENGKPEPFSFSYEVKDAESGNDFSHKAESDGSTVKGEYKVLLPDGRRQKVTYTADSQGYNADVQYDGEAAAGGASASGFSGGGAGGGYPSGGGGGGGYPSGGPSGGGFPSGGSSNGGAQGYPSRPSSNYLPPGK